MTHTEKKSKKNDIIIRKASKSSIVFLTSLIGQPLEVTGKKNRPVNGEGRQKTKQLFGGSGRQTAAIHFHTAVILLVPQLF